LTCAFNRGLDAQISNTDRKLNRTRRDKVELFGIQIMRGIAASLVVLHHSLEESLAGDGISRDLDDAWRSLVSLPINIQVILDFVRECGWSLAPTVRGDVVIAGIALARLIVPKFEQNRSRDDFDRSDQFSVRFATVGSRFGVGETQKELLQSNRCWFPHIAANPLMLQETAAPLGSASISIT
jgi:hypothetical protein